MKHTLKDFRDFYDNYIKGVKLLFAESEVDIIFNKKGSFKLVTIFDNIDFYYVDIIDGMLILSIDEI